MPYLITSQCIQCDRCFSSCPTNAIQRDGQQYWIDANQCNGCEGAYGVPQCWAVCPTNDGCISFTDGIAALGTGEPSRTLDYWDSWFDTYNRLVVRLKGAHQSEYWYSWFDSYSSILSRVRSQHANAGVAPRS